jgi:hypothetical protein
MPTRMTDMARLGAVIDAQDSSSAKEGRVGRPDRLPTKNWRKALLLSSLLDGSSRKPALRPFRGPASREGT